MSAHSQEPQIPVIPADPKKIRKIWLVALFLGVITAIEFVFAFTMTDPSLKYARIIIFILLTLVKAFGIMAEFMHLNHEKKGLVYSIVFPLLFLLWLILAALMESSAIENAVNTLWLNY